jgi:CDP-diglyceride synthetase
VAGATAIVVVTFAITSIGLKPFVFPGSFALALLAAVLCPLGQLTASLILPKVDAPASALRRIDSLLLLAPAWALVVGHLI